MIFDESEKLYVGKPIVFDDGINDPEYGFITHWNNDYVYCRFFRYNRPIDINELSTISKSEGCQIIYLWSFPLDQDKINTIIDKLRANPEKYGWVEQE